MTRQTPSPLKSLRLSPTNEPIMQLVRQVESGVMDINPPYQRGDVWTLDQRIALIHSLLTGTPVPAVIINLRGYKSKPFRSVIDGKQRLTTIMMFIANHFMIPATWLDPRDIARVTWEDISTAPAEVRMHYGADETGPYVRYSDLTHAGEMTVDMWALPVATATVKTIREEAEIYLRVNGGGTRQTEEDMANAARVADGRS